MTIASTSSKRIRAAAGANLRRRSHSVISAGELIVSYLLLSAAIVLLPFASIPYLRETPFGARISRGAEAIGMRQDWNMFAGSAVERDFRFDVFVEGAQGQLLAHFVIHDGGSDISLLKVLFQGPAMTSDPRALASFARFACATTRGAVGGSFVRLDFLKRKAEPKEFKCR